MAKVISHSMKQDLQKYQQAFLDFLWTSEPLLCVLDVVTTMFELIYLSIFIKRGKKIMTLLKIMDSISIITCRMLLY